MIAAARAGKKSQEYRYFSVNPALKPCSCHTHALVSNICSTYWINSPQTSRPALRSGELSGAQAVEVARGAIVAPNTETQLLNLAKHATVRDLRDATSRVVAAATDEAARHKQIHKSRSLKSWRDPDGAFILKGRMTVANGALVMAALKPFQDEIFKAARKSGEYATPEAYAADAHMGRHIPGPLRTAVEERDRVCQVPTCDVTLGLEIDHIKPFSEGGAASYENLVRLCKRHHLQKTHDGYRLERIEVEKADRKGGCETRWAWRAPPDLRRSG